LPSSCGDIDPSALGQRRQRAERLERVDCSVERPVLLRGGAIGGEQVAAVLDESGIAHDIV